MGFIDNAVLILCFYVTFLSIEKYFELFFNKKINPFLNGVISCSLGNTFSDWLGFGLQGEFILANYVALGCISGMVLIPILEICKKIHNEIIDKKEVNND
jgi:CDP-diglyceride synthetase